MVIVTVYCIKCSFDFNICRVNLRFNIIYINIMELGVPVKFAGVGEGIDDLKPFEAEDYVKAII